MAKLCETYIAKGDASAVLVFQLSVLACAQEVAEFACTCERYVGTQSGGMDQAISMMGMPGVAQLINFHPVPHICSYTSILCLTMLFHHPTMGFRRVCPLHGLKRKVEQCHGAGASAPLLQSQMHSLVRGMSNAAIT